MWILKIARFDRLEVGMLFYLDLKRERLLKTILLQHSDLYEENSSDNKDLVRKSRADHGVADVADRRASRLRVGRAASIA